MHKQSARVYQNTLEYNLKLSTVFPLVRDLPQVDQHVIKTLHVKQYPSLKTYRFSRAVN